MDSRAAFSKRLRGLAHFGGVREVKLQWNQFEGMVAGKCLHESFEFRGITPDNDESLQSSVGKLHSDLTTESRRRATDSCRFSFEVQFLHI